MLVSRPLAQLRPEWLTTGELRYQMGVEFDCPRHSPRQDTSHRMRLWFRNPGDGEEPVDTATLNAELYPRLVFRTGHQLDNLTLTPAGTSDMPIQVLHCWTGYVLEGTVYDSVRFASW